MTPKPQTICECSHCGHQLPKWQGQCPQCGKWGTISESQAAITATVAPTATASPTTLFRDIATSDQPRLTTSITELDRVLGGGLVCGSLLLFGGEPGIGKSTLVLQLAQAISKPVLYISGEESGQQIKQRIDRLGVAPTQISYLGETNADILVATIAKQQPTLAIIDSIQTISTADVAGIAGSTNQVRACTVKLLEIAKRHNITVLVIGHITKGGEVAGPKTLEHLVDTVLYLEGDRHHAYRILRTVKNRFGSTDEVGIFEMTGQGLREVADPAAVFLANRATPTPGTVIAAALEGSRVFLIEVQALVSPTVFGYPQRKAFGADLNRLQLLTAVLTRRLDLKLGNQDIYLNLAGGIHITEPALDLVIALAIIAAEKGKVVPADTVIFGEIGLGGEVRSVSQPDKRIKEAAKLGFKRVILPAQTKQTGSSQVKLEFVETIGQAAKIIE